MPLRDVEPVEVVAGRLHLTTVHDRVAQAEEDVLEFPPDLRDQVEVPAANGDSGQRHVDAFLGETSIELGAPKLLLACVEGRLEALAERVQPHSRLAIPDLAQRELERALTAQDRKS